MEHFVEIAFGLITAINFGMSAKLFDMMISHVMNERVHCKYKDHDE